MTNQEAIDTIEEHKRALMKIYSNLMSNKNTRERGIVDGMDYALADLRENVPSAQPEIIRCKDCKFYSPVNKETKTGICNLTMGAIHQIFGDDWFCAGAERRK